VLADTTQLGKLFHVFTTLLEQLNKCSAVDEMGDRLATTDICRNLGALCRAPLRGELQRNKYLSVNVFKAPLDRFWMDQDVKFDFTTDLTGTGDRSVNVTSET